MNEEELARFEKERYEKFIKPLMDMNSDQLEKMGAETKSIVEESDQKIN